MRKWLVGLLAAGLCAATALADGVATLPVAENYTSTQDWTALTGFSGSGVGTYSDGRCKFDANKDWLMVQFDGEPAELTFDVKGNEAKSGTAPASFLVEESADAETWSQVANLDETAFSTDYASFGPYTLAAESRYVRWTYANKYGFNLGLNNVAIGSGGPVAFALSLDPSEDFTVVQGKSATITANVRGAQGDVTYSWSVNGTPIDLAGNVYTVDSAEIGEYEVSVEVSDGVADPLSASVKYTVVEAPVVTGDVLTRETTGVTGSQYKDWTATGDSGTVYAGQSAGGNDSIQLRTTSPAGIVITESAGSDVASVTVEWNAATAAEKRSLEIYGSADAYAGPADLYGDAKGELLGTIARDGATLEIPEGYPYVGVLAKGGALYLTSVAFEFAGASGPSVSLSASATEVEVGGELTITATAKNFSAEPEWAWEGNDGGNADGAVYTVNTAGVGDFTIKATATAGDEIAEKEITVTVTPALVPHAITVTTDGNGTAEADVATAKAGEPVNLTVVPNEGFKLASITVNGEAITGTSFEMPDEDVTVAVAFVEKPVLSGDVLTRETTGVEGSQYKDWTATGDSGTKYAGQSAGGNDSIQLRATSPAGIVITESAGSDVASVTVEWNDATAEKRSIEIYGSADAYAGPADLYGDAKGELLGTLAKGETTLEVPEGYPYVGILAKGGALYLTSVAFDFGGASGPSVSLSASATEVEVGGELTVTATAKNFSADVEWAWEGNDGGSADGAVYTVNTAVAGDFTIKATATAGDEIAEKEITVTVTPALVPHAITVTTDGNGTAEADVAEAKAGESVNLTVVPNEGFKLASITVNGEAITGTSFEMPDEDVTVAVAFVEKPVLSGDVLTRETTGVTGTSYKDWTATGDSGTEYAGNSAGGNDSIQLRTTSPAGIVITKSTGSDVTSVTVEWNDATAEGRKIAIYGSTAAYTGPADLYGDAKGELLGEIAKGETTLEIPAGYPYIGILAKGGALYLSSVAIDFGGAAAFSIALDPDEDFEVQQGKDAAITATVRGAQGDVTYSWSVNGTPIDLAGNVYAIDSAEVGGPFTVVCEASDGVSEPVSASVSYTVVEVPPVTGDEFELISSLEDLEDGAEYVITDNTKAYAMKAELSSGSTKRLLNEAVEPVDDVITTEDASIIWKLVEDADGNFAFYNESAGKYIGWSSGNSAKLQDDAFANTISYEEDLFVVMATSTAELDKPRKLQFNSASNSLQFAYYEGTQKNLNFFKKAGASAPKIVYSGETTIALGDSFEIIFGLLNYEGDFEWVLDSREGGTIVPDGRDGLYTWTPTEATDGVTIKVVARNGELDIASKEVTLTVTEPGPQPGEPAIVFGGDDSGVVGQPVNFTVTAVNISDPAVYLDGFEFPAASSLTDGDLTENYPNVSFTPDAAGDYVFNYSAGAVGSPEYAAGTLTISVSDGPGPQPSEAGITKMTIASGKMTIEFFGEGAQVLLSDDMETWTPVDGAISPFSFDMNEAGKKYIGVR